MSQWQLVNSVKDEVVEAKEWEISAQRFLDATLNEQWQLRQRRENAQAEH